MNVGPEPHFKYECGSSTHGYADPCPLNTFLTNVRRSFFRYLSIISARFFQVYKKYSILVTFSHMQLFFSRVMQRHCFSMKHVEDEAVSCSYCDKSFKNKSGGGIRRHR
jgi:hypothetical protein